MDALFSVLCYVAIIVIGQALRLANAFPRDGVRPISILILNVTLPCSIIVFLSGIELSAALFAPFLAGLIANWIVAIAAFALTRREASGPGMSWLKPFSILNMSGYNVGTFAMPFTMGVLPPSSFVAVCLFDAGNSVMVTGGTYAVVCGKDNGAPLRQIAGVFKRLAAVPAIWTYVFVMTLSALHWTLPEPILQFCRIVGGANPFLSMLMIGLSINLRLDWAKFRPLMKLLLWRVGINAVLAAAVYFFVPVDEGLRFACVLALMAPMPVMGLIFTMKAKLDYEAAANLNSASVVLSVFIMTALIALHP